MKRHWPILVVALATFLAFAQSSRYRARVSEVTDLESRLSELNSELTELDAATSQGPLLSEAEMEELGHRSESVHELRGDVTMARRELELVSAGVAQLTRQYEARSNELAFARAPVFPEGYRQGPQLHNVGQSTPESTLETFFHACIAGNVELAAPCFDAMKGQEQLDDAAKQRTADEFKSMFSRFPGYQIAWREQTTPTRVKLGIRTAPEAEVIPITFDLNDREWVINEKESELFK